MKKSKKKIVKNILISFFVLMLGAVWAFTVFMYNDTVNQRFESYKPLMLKIEDFD